MTPWWGGNYSNSMPPIDPDHSVGIGAAVLAILLIGLAVWFAYPFL